MHGTTKGNMHREGNNSTKGNNKSYASTISSEPDFWLALLAVPEVLKRMPTLYTQRVRDQTLSDPRTTLAPLAVPTLQAIPNESKNSLKLLSTLKGGG